MKRSYFFRFLLLTILIFCSLCINAQDVYKDQRSAWLQKAESTTPALTESVKSPVSLVSIVKDENAFQKWKAVQSNPVDSLYKNSFKKQSGVVADFGEHLTGYFTFSVEDLGRAVDAPLRIKFTFGSYTSQKVSAPFFTISPQ